MLKNLGGSDAKESPHNAVDPGSIPGSGKIPGGEHGNPVQFFLPGESHGQGSLAGYSPWGFKESGTTERLIFLLKDLEQCVAGRRFKSSLLR